MSAARKSPAKKKTTKRSPHNRRAPGQTQTTVSLSEELLAEIKACADEDDRSVSNYFVLAAKEKMRRDKK